MVDIPITAAELERAVAFYEQAFACPALRRANGAEIRLGHVTLHVCESTAPDLEQESGQTPLLEFRVDSVASRVERWVAAGARLVGPLSDPSGASEQPARYAQVADPFGHIWAFHAEV